MRHSSGQKYSIYNRLVLAIAVLLLFGSLVSSFNGFSPDYSRRIVSAVKHDDHHHHHQQSPSCSLARIAEPPSNRRRTLCTSSLSMAASNSSNEDMKKKKKKKQQGVYSRPSAAIERGSGFFIPGLEGPRVRLVFGVVILILTTLNHIIITTTTTTTTTTVSTFPERLALIYAVLLLLQAAIEFAKEEKGYAGRLETSTNETGESSISATADYSPSYSQMWSSSTSSSSSSTLSDEAKEKIEWAAASYLALTPATCMMLLNRNDGIVYRSASTTTTLIPPPVDKSNDDRQEGSDGATRAAFEALDKSSSGRVSLSATHPTVESFVSDNQEHGRCVVLQRITDDYCWMMTSNQLLPAFTRQDLRWLGQLAKHVNE